MGMNMSKNKLPIHDANIRESSRLFENLWNVMDTAAFLSVSEKTIYDWVHKREIPFVKVKRLLRFRPTEIAKWLQKNGGQNGN